MIQLGFYHVDGHVEEHVGRHIGESSHISDNTCLHVTLGNNEPPHLVLRTTLHSINIPLIRLLLFL